MSDPQFVSLEGIDKTGKSLICDILETDYPEFEYVTDPTRLDPWDRVFRNGTKFDIPGIADSFQFFSARLHCYQRRIKPALEAEVPVVADRFSDSWFAYQSVFQKEFFDCEVDPIEYFQQIHDLSVEYNLLETPDLTILITIDKEMLRERLNRTEELTEFEQSVSDQWKVHERYQELLEQENDRIREVEDNGEGIMDVYANVTDVLENEGFL